MGRWGRMGDWSSGQQDQWSNYGGQDWQTHQSQDFQSQSQDFQQFDYGNYGQQQQPETDPSNPYLVPNAPNPYTGSMFVPDPSPGPQDYKAVHGSPEWEDEPPLLEELGIHPDHILQKTLNVLNPMMTTEAAIAGDSDLAGPIVFALAFGSFIMFSGKLYFNYIYGISFVCVVSVIGYCLLPLVGLSGISVLFSLSGLIGNLVAGMAICWCTVSASKLFVTALEMKQQQLLVAYPCFLLYGVFALITMF